MLILLLVFCDELSISAYFLKVAKSKLRWDGDLNSATVKSETLNMRLVREWEGSCVTCSVLLRFYTN